MTPVKVPIMIGKGTQEAITAGLGCIFSSFRSSLLHWFIGGERLLGAWTRGSYGEAKSEERVSTVGHESSY